MSIYADAKYKDVPVETKQALFDEVKADMRYEHQLYGCYECGICVAACPSARFYDFSPRVFAQVMAREDVDTFYELLNDRVWDCSQCFSCTRCPRQNNPGGIITIMREVAVNHGLQSAKDALQATVGSFTKSCQLEPRLHQICCNQIFSLTGGLM